MPLLTSVVDINGVAQKLERLGLRRLSDEVASILQGFKLIVEEKKHANGTKELRQSIDDGFMRTGGWTKVVVGGVDWSKQSETGAKIGVEVQVSGRSDMLAVDIMHLKEELESGSIDVGLIVVPDDKLSRFLTDRTPNLRTALRHVEHRAKDLPIRILAFGYDGVGPPLAKARTNLGRLME
jgi:hypothetical protein